MRPLLLVTELEDYTIAYANGLARHLPVTLAVPRRRYGHLTRWFSPGVDLRLLDWPRHRSPANLRLLMGLDRLIRQERPDIIHLLSNTTLWLNLVAPLWRRRALLTTVHDVEVHPGDAETRTLPTWASTLMARQSPDLVVHGPALRAQAASRFRKAPNRVHVLSHPAICRYADLAREAGLTPNRAPGSFNVLMFGRIFAYKGLNHLIRAEALLGRRIPGLRLTIAGRGDDPWQLRDEMGDPARYDVRNRFIEDTEVAQLFLDADVVVLPYIEASQSGVLNVAAAFGKPVVASDLGELGSTVRENRLGLVVPAGQPQQLADALATLAAQPDTRNFLGAQALAWAKGENAPETVGAQAAALYHEIVQKRRCA